MYQQVLSKDVIKHGKITKGNFYLQDNVTPFKRVLYLKEGIYTTFSPQISNELSVIVKKEKKETKKLISV